MRINHRVEGFFIDKGLAVIHHHLQAFAKVFKGNPQAALRRKYRGIRADLIIAYVIGVADFGRVGILHTDKIFWWLNFIIINLRGVVYVKRSQVLESVLA